MTIDYDNGSGLGLLVGRPPSIGFGATPAGLVALREATLWLDSRYSVAGEQVAANQGTGGSALDAKYGSTTGADTNDPLLLTHTGENYVRLTGVNGNDLRVPDEAALDITGDLELVMRFRADDWTNGDVSLLVRSTQSNPNRAWWLRLLSTGELNLRWYPTGEDASIKAVGSSGASFTNGQTYWVKITLDVDDGGDARVSFYQADDQATEPSSWTFISSDTDTGVSSLPSVASPLYVGMTTAFSGEPTGNFYRAIVRDGIDGTTVLDINAATDITDAGATSFTASTGQTATVNRGNTGRKTTLVTRPIWLFGVDDFLEVADNALLDLDASTSMTMMVVERRFPNATASSRSLLAKRSDIGAANPTVGWMIVSASSNRIAILSGDGTFQASRVSLNGDVVDGALSNYTAVFDRDTDLLTLYNNTTILNATTAIGSLGDASSADVLRVGAAPNGSTYNDGEIAAVAVWRRALTTDEIAAINTYYGTV